MSAPLSSLIILTYLSTSALPPRANSCFDPDSSYGRGREYRRNSPARRYAAVREESPCEMDNFAESLRLDPWLVATATAAVNPLVEVKILSNLEDFVLYTEIQEYAAGKQRRWRRRYRNGAKRHRLDGLPMWRVSVYRPLCQAPCTMKLEMGKHHLALGTTPDKALKEVRMPLQIKEPVTIHTKHYAYREGRIFGWLMLGAGLAAITGGFAGAAGDNFDNFPDNSQGQVHPGALAMSLGLGTALAGLVTLLLFRSDETSVTLEPFAAEASQVKAH